MKRRQALLIELGAIEEHLGMVRSVVPKRQRAEARRQVGTADRQQSQQS
jgi:hypothetical protein